MIWYLEFAGTLKKTLKNQYDEKKKVSEFTVHENDFVLTFLRLQDVLTYSFFESLPAERLYLKEEEKKNVCVEIFHENLHKRNLFFSVFTWTVV